MGRGNVGLVPDLAARGSPEKEGHMYFSSIEDVSPATATSA